MKLTTHILNVRTKGPGFTDITADVRLWVRGLASGDGQLTLFIRHTSASLVIQENADPDVLADLMDALECIAPRSGLYRHATEGADDMPAHIKTMLTSTSLSIPVIGGGALLGTWQAVYLLEHRDQPHQREIVLHYSGTLQQ